MEATVHADDTLLRQAMMDPLVRAVCNPPGLANVDEMLVARTVAAPWRGYSKAKERLAKAI